MRFHMRGVDHQRGGWTARLGKTDEDIFPHTLRRPANEAVVERLARTVATGRIFPPAATLQDMDYATDHTTVVHPRHPSRIPRQERSKTLELFTSKPEHIIGHRKLPLWSLNHKSDNLVIQFIGPEPKAFLA